MNLQQEQGLGVTIQAPKVSVIVPVYKAEAYLNRCMDSLLTQTFRNFEVLLIDDGSPDRSGEICDEYAKKDSRVRVFHEKNQGVSVARNKGLEQVRGECIAFVDADDYVERDYLMHLLQFSEDLIISGSQTIPSLCINRSKDQIYKKDEIKFLLEQRQSALSVVWGKLYKRDIIVGNSLAFNLKARDGEDLLFNLDYIKYCNSIHAISSVDYFYYNPTRFPRDIRCNYSVEEVQELCGLIYERIQTVEKFCGESWGKRMINYYILLFPLKVIYKTSSDASYYALFKQYNSLAGKESFYKHPVCSPIIRFIRLIVTFYKLGMFEDGRKWSEKLLSLYGGQMRIVGFGNMSKKLWLSYFLLCHGQIRLHDMMCRLLKKSRLVKSFR